MAANFIVFSVLVALLQSHFLIVSPCMSCSSEWTSFGNHCYLLVADDKTFDVAEQFCQGLSCHGRPSHLASIISQEEHDFLILLITSTWQMGKNTWFGYRLDQSGDPSSGRFIDGSPSGGYNNWYDKEPSGNGECIQIFDGLKNFTWDDTTCYTTRSSICKMPARF